MSKAEPDPAVAPPEPAKRLPCFVIMPISDQPDYKPGHFREVYDDLIRPSLEEAGYEPIRADQVHEANLIHLDILGRIVDAPLAICDLSALNPNVMFELGIRQAFDKPVVLIKDSKTRNPFDISPIRYVQYDETLSYRGMLSSRKSLIEAIHATAKAKTGEGVNSIVSLLGLRAAAIKPSEQNPETARMTLIEKALADISGEVRQMRSEVRRAAAEPTALALYPDSMQHANTKPFPPKLKMSIDEYQAWLTQGLVPHVGFKANAKPYDVEALDYLLDPNEPKKT